MSLFEEQRKEVLRLRNAKQFEDSIYVCDTILNTIKDNNIDSDTDMWFFTLRKGMNYRKLGQCKRALVYIEESMRYCSTQDEYMESIWMIGASNDVLGNKKRAVKFYNKCLDYYRRNNMHNEESRMLFNIGRVYDDVKTIYKALNDYYLNCEDSFRLDNVYDTLAEIYIKRNDIINAEKMINNITDLRTKQRLIVKMSSTSGACI